MSPNPKLKGQPKKWPHEEVANFRQIFPSHALICDCLMTGKSSKQKFSQFLPNHGVLMLMYMMYHGKSTLNKFTSSQVFGASGCFFMIYTDIRRQILCGLQMLHGNVKVALVGMLTHLTGSKPRRAWEGLCPAYYPCISEKNHVTKNTKMAPLNFGRLNTGIL